MFFQNKYLRYLAINAYRFYASISTGQLDSKVFINSTPKSGTHLVTKFFDYVPDLMNSGLHIKTFQVNELSDSPLSNDNFVLDEGSFENVLSKVKRGQYITAHLPYSEKITEILVKNNFKVLSFDREHIALFFSELFYIRGLSFNDRMLRYAGWSADQNVSSYMFENLLGDNRNGSDQTRFVNFKMMLEFIGCNISDEDLSKYISNFQNAGSFTMRKGKAGSWKEDILTFSPELQKLILDGTQGNTH